MLSYIFFRNIFKYILFFYLLIGLNYHALSKPNSSNELRRIFNANRTSSEHILEAVLFSNSDSLTANLRILDYADSLYENNQFESAIAHYKKSIPISYELKNWAGYFNAKIKITSSLGKLHKLDGLISLCHNNVQEIIQTLGPNTLIETKALQVLGYSYFINSNYEEAQECYLKSLKILNNQKEEPKADLADVYHNLSNVYYRIGIMEESIQMLYSSIDLKKQIYGNDHLSLADSYFNLGNVYGSIGELDLSLQYFTETLTIYKKHYSEDHYLLGDIYNGIGNLYEAKEQFEEAIQHLQKAYQIGIKTFGEDHYIVSNAYLNLCSIYIKLENYNKALDYSLKSLKSHQNQYGEYNITTAYSYMLIGDCQMKLGNDLSAFTNLNTSKNLMKHIFKNKSLELATVHIKIADFYFNRDNPDSALFHIQKSIIENVIDFNEISISKNSNIEKCLDKSLLLKSLDFKGKALLKKHALSNNIVHLKQAVNAFQLWSELHHETLHSFFLNSDKVSIGNKSSEIYFDAMESSLKLYELTQQKYYFELAFHFSEKKKSAVLKHEISKLKAKDLTNIPDSILNRKKEILNSISVLQSSLLLEKDSVDTDSQNVSELNSELFALKREHESLINHLSANFPSYNHFRKNSKVSTLAEVMNSLKSGKTIVEYIVGNEWIYTFIIDQNNYEVKKSPKHDLLNDAIDKIPVFLKNENILSYSELAYQLYQQLIEPLALKSNNLIIIPDDILWRLNFDILIDQPLKGKDFRTLNYLIREHTISYDYSATLLLSKSEKDSNTKSVKESLAFSYNGPDETDTGGHLSMSVFRDKHQKQLPGTLKEVEALSNVLEGDYYYGTLASERNFKENAGGYKVLHLALHGEANDIEPMSSKLIFSQSKDSIEDNFLYAFELQNLFLGADLAVLSACNTGYGKIEKGEGVMSLGRAFLFAGCNSLVLSQWELSDLVAPPIIEGFYRNLKQGKAKSESLRIAKLDYLKNADNPSSNPYYWASLVQLGNDEPIFINKSRTWVLVMSCILLTLLFMILIYRKSR